MHTNLIPIKKEFLENHGIFIKPNTLYAWHSRKKFKNIFVKVSKRLFIDLEKFKETFLNNQKS